jgi:hypothetical protein
MQAGLFAPSVRFSSPYDVVCDCSEKGDTMENALLPQDIVRIIGPIDDELLSAILATGADVADIEIAYQWYAGMDDIMGEAGLPLEGARLEVYEILRTGDVFDVDA